jgi:hypothetical protein
MNAPVTVAVLITYYDETDLLAECLRSLFAGPEAPDEVLVYDDASPRPAADYVPPGCPVRLLRADRNRGAVYGRNLLQGEAVSEYVHFHDADDLFRPAWCARVKDAARRTGADVILTDVSAFGWGLVPPWQERIMELSELRAGRDFVRYAIRHAVLPAASTCRRSCACQIGGHLELRASQDWDFHVRLAASGVSYAVVDEPLAVKRERSGGDSSDRVRLWDGTLDVIELLRRQLPPQYLPDLAEVAARAAGGLCDAGKPHLARRGFELTRQLGGSRYEGRSPLFRALCVAFGPLAAERLGRVYRRALPGWLRARLRPAGTAPPAAHGARGGVSCEAESPGQPVWPLPGTSPPAGSP